MRKELNACFAKRRNTAKRIEEWTVVLFWDLDPDNLHLGIG